MAGGWNLELSRGKDAYQTMKRSEVIEKRGQRLSPKELRMDLLFKLITLGACAMGVGIFFALLLFVWWQGWEQLSVGFILDAAKGTGVECGIRYQILGTLILIATAMILVTPVACAVAITLVTLRKASQLGRTCLALLHVLNATPSILFGIIGFVVFVRLLHLQKSWFSGGVILALMMLPTVATALIARLRTIPSGYIETAKALGFNADKIITTIYLPYGWGGLLTGLVMGVARACGETAPIMFCAVVFSGATLPTGIVDNPVLALPYHIFNLTQDVAHPLAIKTAWTSALVLVFLAAGLTALTIPARAKSHEEAKN
jgi:phosphate transport system permease protein